MAECMIIKAREQDIKHVAHNIRREHKQEIIEMVNMEPAEALLLSVNMSSIVFAGLVDNRALFITGVTQKRLLANVTSIWMLATREIDKYKLEVASALRLLFTYAHSLAECQVLEQYLPLWYKKGIKWLKWLGWQENGVKNIGIKNLPHLHMLHYGEY